MNNNVSVGSITRDSRILVSTCYGHFMSHFNMLTFTAIVLPLTVRLHLDLAAVLSISFYMYLLFGLTAFPWGLAADRWGPKGLFLIYYLGSGLSCLAASLNIDNPTMLTLSLAGLGFFSGIYHPAGLGLISKEVSRISVGMGFNGMFGNLGLATAPLAAGAINWLFGPAWVYVMLGGMNLAGILLMFFFPFTVSAKPVQTHKTGNRGNLNAFLILLIAMMFGGIVYRGATVIVPAYFELKNGAVFAWAVAFAGKGVSPNLVATLTVSAIYLFGMLGQYSGGLVAERFSPGRCYLLFHIATIPLALIMGAVANLPLVAAGLIYFFFLLGMQPAENTLVAGYTPRNLQHTAFGAKFVLTFGVGALAVKMVAGIEHAYSIAAVFPTLAGISTLLVMVIFWLLYYTRAKS